MIDEKNGNKVSRFFYIVFIIFAMSLGGALAPVVLDYATEIFTNYRISATKYEWGEYQISDLVISKPAEYKLLSEDMQFPDEINNVTLEKQTLLYEGDKIYFLIGFLKYLPDLELSLEGSYNGMLQNMRRAGVEFINIERENLIIDNRDAIRYKLEFKSDDKYRIIQEGINVVDGQKIHTISISYEKKHSNFSEVTDKILSSVKFI